MQTTKKIDQGIFLNKLKELENLKVTAVFQSPVNMIWVDLADESNNKKYKLVFDGFWFIERNKEVFVINEDFFNESETDFMLRLRNKCALVEKQVTKIIKVNIDEDWGYIEVAFDQDFVLLAKPNNFGYVGLYDLQTQKCYSVRTKINNQFIQEASLFKK